MYALESLRLGGRVSQGAFVDGRRSLCLYVMAHPPGSYLPEDYPYRHLAFVNINSRGSPIMLSPASESSFGRLHLYHEERKGGRKRRWKRGEKQERSPSFPNPYRTPHKTGSRHLEKSIQGVADSFVFRTVCVGSSCLGMGCLSLCPRGEYGTLRRWTITDREEGASPPA